MTSLSQSYGIMFYCHSTGRGRFFIQYPISLTGIEGRFSGSISQRKVFDIAREKWEHFSIPPTEIELAFPKGTIVYTINRW